MLRLALIHDLDEFPAIFLNKRFHGMTITNKRKVEDSPTFKLKNIVKLQTCSFQDANEGIPKTDPKLK